MKKLLLSIMAIATLGVVQAKKVKIQVDMTGKTVSGNGVHVAGSFQGWDPTTTQLSNGGSGNIYSVILDMPAGTYYEFKFLNGNAWADEESIPAICKKESPANGGSNGNRWYYIDSTANDTTVFPAVLFSGDAPAGKIAIRFAVDMKNETVSANGVHIAGAIQGWDPATSSMANLFPNNKVYEYIAYVDSGSYGYKYVNGNAWGSDESIPSSCKVGNDRGVTTNVSTALPKVCYASCVACPAAPIPAYSLRFLIDMSNSDCDGGYDSVTVAGAGARLTAFGAGLKMTELGSTKVFAIIVDSLDSGEVEFKFRYHKNGNTNWEGGNNRIFALAAHDTIDLTCFGSRVVGACASKPAPSSITFKVDMSNETPGIIYLIGTFQTPNWKEGALRMSPSVGEPGVFEVTVNNICPGVFNYKFVNGDSSISANEESFPNSTDSSCYEPSGVGGYNRIYTRTSVDPVTLYYVFNTCTLGSGGPVGISEAALNTSFKLFPNPAQSYTMVEFNDKATAHNVVVMDITGKAIQSFTDYKQNTLLINTDELSKGIYFIKASNTRNESVTSKLIVR